MVDKQFRDALLSDIRELSGKFPVAYLELIQPHLGNGAAKGSIVTNAKEVFLEDNIGVTWPVGETRELWLRSVDLIPDATARDGEPDAGFIEWLWTQTQRRWTARHEIGYAINPYQMWQSALITGCAGHQAVCSNPLLANAIEITRIASYAAEIATTAEKCEAEAKQCRQMVEESIRVRDSMSGQSTDFEKRLARDKVTITLKKYRWAQMKRVQLRSLADVVVCYETALIPHTRLDRPASDMHTSEGTTFFRRVAIELTNFANSKATTESGEPPKQVEPQVGGDQIGSEGGNKPKSKRGRKQGSTTSNSTEDQRITEAWKRGQGDYKTHEELANALRMRTDDVKMALDRQRKRVKSQEIINAKKLRQGQ